MGPNGRISRIAVFLVALSQLVALNGVEANALRFRLSAVNQLQSSDGANNANSAYKTPNSQSLPNVLSFQFLHLTDIHLDTHYKHGTSVASTCHRVETKNSNSSKHDSTSPNTSRDYNLPITTTKNRSKKVGRDANAIVGPFGSPLSGCDSPETLVNHTFGYLKEYIQSKKQQGQRGFDWVVWTGDNSRHDGDPLLPRTQDEVFAMNEIVTNYVKDTFEDMVVIPSIGNNDIPAHNNLPFTDTEPNMVLDFYYNLWSRWIPQSQASTYRRIGCFHVEPVPGLMVASINSLFLYSSNANVSDCSDPSSGARAVLQWLEDVLDQAETQKKKVVVTGHVPPSPFTYREVCYGRYTRLMALYKNTYLASFWGHVNVDHVLFAMEALTGDNGHGKGSFSTSSKQEVLPNGQGVTVMRDKDGRQGISSPSYFEYVMSHYRDVAIRSQRKTAYGLTFAAPSVVPAFNPSLRIWRWGINNDLYENGMDGVMEDGLVHGLGGSVRLEGYTQLYLNLTDWNLRYARLLNIPPNEAIDENEQEKKLSPPEWQVLYDAGKSYGIVSSSFDARGWSEVASKISGFACEIGDEDSNEDALHEDIGNSAPKEDTSEEAVKDPCKRARTRFERHFVAGASIQVGV